MARSRTPGRITIGSRAVAVAILAEALHNASNLGGGTMLDQGACNIVADNLVGMAWDVEYKPTAERLIIVLDAGITSSDKMRSTPEDQPRQIAREGDEQCPHISNGQQCLLKAGPAGHGSAQSHLFEGDIEADQCEHDLED